MVPPSLEAASSRRTRAGRGTPLVSTARFSMSRTVLRLREATATVLLSNYIVAPSRRRLLLIHSQSNYIVTLCVCWWRRRLPVPDVVSTFRVGRGARSLPGRDQMAQAPPQPRQKRDGRAQLDEREGAPGSPGVERPPRGDGALPGGAPLGRAFLRRTRQAWRLHGGCILPP